jgi:hypothetical protein
MPAKKKAAKKSHEESEPTPEIITVSQLAKLSDDEKKAFRQSGGTVTSDPS